MRRISLLACLSVVLAEAAATAQAPVKDKLPEWVFAQDLVCRRHDEPEFTAKTARWGMEVYRDGDVALLLTEKGMLAARKGFADITNTMKVDVMRWQGGLVVACPGIARSDLFGIEVFHEPNLKRLLYVSQTGAVTLNGLPSAATKERVALKSPRLVGFWRLAAGEKNYRVAAHVDEQHGQLLFLSETGHVAWADAATSLAQEAARPLAAWTLGCRTKDDKKVEQRVNAYHLDRAGLLLLVSENGALAARRLAKAPEAKLTPPRNSHGMVLEARRFSEHDGFTRLAPRYGVECFEEEATGTRLYLAENGNIAAP